MLLEKGEEAYLPLLPVVRQFKSRKKEVELPLFPSYVFCRFDYKNRFRVLETHGVMRIITFKGTPASIPDWQIESLKTVLEMDPDSLRMESYLRQGDLVEVTDGPFRGLKGTITNMKGETRLIITIDGIMQTVSVEINREQVEPVEEPEEAL